MSFSHVRGLGYELDRYADECPVGRARDLYFERYELGDGGYEDDWVHFKFGAVPVVLPNTRGRKRNIRAHDLHHVATGCNAVWNQGEIDVTAYEVRAGGCGTFLFGWFIILNVFSLGLVIRPRAMFRCFVQSKGTRNLFQRRVGRHFDALTVAELRRYLGFPDSPRRADLTDVGAFVAWSALALAATAVSLAALLAPLVLLGWWLA